MQSAISPQLTNTLLNHPDLVCPLMPLEEQVKEHWPYVPGKNSLNCDTDIGHTVTEVVKEVTIVRNRSFISRTVKGLRRRVLGGNETVQVQSQSVGMLVQVSERPGSTASASLTSDERDWLTRLMQETSLGHFIRDLV